MIKRFKNYSILQRFFITTILFLFLPGIFYFPFLKHDTVFSFSTPGDNKGINSSSEKRASPPYDIVMSNDGMFHFRVLFWVPKNAAKFMPYADDGIVTDVSSHGPVEKWSVKETQRTDGDEKLVFIFVPKTFVFLYGSGFEKVIHLKCE